MEWGRTWWYSTGRSGEDERMDGVEVRNGDESEEITPLL